MNTKSNLIRIPPAVQTCARIQRLGQPAARELFPYDAITTARAHARVRLPLTEDRVGQFYETLSYLVIWLCGLFGIALCFR